MGRGVAYTGRHLVRVGVRDGGRGRGRGRVKARVRARVRVRVRVGVRHGATLELLGGEGDVAVHAQLRKQRVDLAWGDN